MKGNETGGSFEDLIRNKLENHKIPVSELDWEKIARRLPKKKKSVHVYRYMLAAAAVLMFLLLRTYNTDNDRHDTHKTTEITAGNGKSSILSHEDFEPADISTGSAQVTEPKQPIKANVSENRAGKSVADDNPISDKNTDNTESDSGQKENTDTEKSTDNSNNDSGSDIMIADNNESVKEKSPDEYDVYEKFPDIEITKSKDKREWLIAGIVGAGSSISAKPGSAPPVTPLYSAVGSTKSGGGSETGVILIPESATRDYSVPLSFGFMVRKNSGKSLGVESGIFYTYLSAEYKLTNTMGSHYIKRRIHYLGIPLNAVFSVWNSNPKWDLYLKAGVMVEKGIYMKTTKNDGIYNLTEVTSIDPLQWSVTAGGGLTYKFASRTGIFIEPQLKHYFDNNQPESIRSRQQTVFGLNAGLRYAF